MGNLKSIHCRIKDDFSKLWKNTFHDSDGYVKLFFDNYFTPDNIRCIYIGDKDPALEEFESSVLFDKSEKAEQRLLSSMFALPYKLSVDEHFFDGRYLCGLATDPEFRKRGLMSRMLESYIREAKNGGVDFLFLIPADENLRRYYYKFGFEDAFPFSINIQNFSSEIANYNFVRIEYFETLESLNVKNGISDSRELEKIIDYIKRKESDRPEGGICHTSEDLACAIHECFVSGGAICLDKNEKGDICGILFLYPGEDITVYYLKSDFPDSRTKMLLKVNEYFPNRVIKTLEYFNSEDLKQETLNIPNKTVGYRGMIKILQKGRLNDKIMKFKGGELSLMLD